MNREIKFRAWTGKEMYLGVQPYLEDYNTPTCMVPAGLDFIEPAGRKRYWYEVPVVSIMQYTGLKDKNGVEIYEGDVLEINHNNEVIICWVEYQSPRDASYCLVNNKGRMCWIGEHYIEYYKVIGNIFETPELINK